MHNIDRKPAMRFRPFAFFLLASCIVVISAGCTLGPKFEPALPPLGETWQEASRPQFTAGPAEKVEWWRSFDDPTLEALIQEAFQHNQRLHMTELRFVQARVANAASFQTLFPLVTGGASAAHVNCDETVKPQVEIASLEAVPPYQQFSLSHRAASPYDQRRPDLVRLHRRKAPVRLRGHAAVGGAPSNVCKSSEY